MKKWKKWMEVRFHSEVANSDFADAVKFVVENGAVMVIAKNDGVEKRLSFQAKDKKQTGAIMLNFVKLFTSEIKEFD